MQTSGFIDSFIHGIEWPVIDPDFLSVLLDSLKYDPASPLQLPSVFMLTFLPLFFIVYALSAKNYRLKKAVVIIASLYLYYKLSGPYVLLLLVLAFITWAAGLAVRRSYPSFWVGLAVAVNVLMLVVFKAAGLFSGLFEGNFAVSLASLAIPAGISFFCFQSIAYVVDCKSGRVEVLKSFTDVLFLLAYFPKMFLGPLVKNSDFIPRMRQEPQRLTSVDRAEAIRSISSGLLKFCVLSRVLGHFLVDPVFADPMAASGPAALLAVYAYTFQLYCDFSGYTDLACGISLFLGIRLPENFNLPYHSATITEFWRRWHISLSSWLREYLYISLGGNRKGKARTYANLMITMILGGLWHGCGPMFLLWGAWHGSLLCAHKFIISLGSGRSGKSAGWFAKTGEGMSSIQKAAGVFFTFNAVAFGWLMFRSPDWTTFISMLHSIFHTWTAAGFSSVAELSAAQPAAELLPGTFAAVSIALSALIAAVITHILPDKTPAAFDRLLSRCGLPAQFMLLFLSVLIALQTNALLFSSTVSALPVYANF